jgi:hypothetical protein
MCLYSHAVAASTWSLVGVIDYSICGEFVVFAQLYSLWPSDGVEDDQTNAWFERTIISGSK